VPGVEQSIDMLDGPTLDISSTAIRQWMADDYVPKYLIPTAVLEYIEQHSLYRAD
jgi:nicotinic acid mononucleotide adenylyltransferase